MITRSRDARRTQTIGGAWVGTGARRARLPVRVAHGHYWKCTDRCSFTCAFNIGGFVGQKEKTRGARNKGHARPSLDVLGWTLRAGAVCVRVPAALSSGRGGRRPTLSASGLLRALFSLCTRTAFYLRHTSTNRRPPRLRPQPPPTPRRRRSCFPWRPWHELKDAGSVFGGRMRGGRCVRSNVPAHSSMSFLIGHAGACRRGKVS